MSVDLVEERWLVRTLRSLAVIFAIPCLLGGCGGNERVSSYRQDHKAFLKELIHCENNYAAERNTPACRAAFKVNSELFPG